MTENEQGLAAASEATTGEIESLYDAWVTDYERDVLAWGYDAPTVCSRRLAALTGPATTRVLDAGCGTGLTGVALRSEGFAEVIGVDLSAESVAHAADRGVYESTRVVDLAEPLPFAADGFGALLCCGVLSYVSDLGSTLGEFVRVVEPGGPIIFTQRTDLWDERQTTAAIDGLVESSRCRADVSEPLPYLPLHPEFGDSVRIRVVTLTVTDR